MAVSREGRGIIPLIGFLLFPCIGYCQTYPNWFLDQQQLNCKINVVGFANPSYYPDSSAAHAIQDGYETCAKYLTLQLTGGQAFWSTEIGTFWMGSNIHEEYDSSLVDIVKTNLSPLDTLFTKKLTAVLLGSSDCLGEGSSLRNFSSVDKISAPSWIESTPKNNKYRYGIGIAPNYYYEKSSWKEAERMAYLNLARDMNVDIKSLQKFGRQGQEIRDEQISVTLSNIQVVARWRDTINDLFYVLVRMSK